MSSEAERRLLRLFTLALVALTLVQFVRCQVFAGDDYNSQTGNSAVQTYITQIAYDRISNLTSLMLSSALADDAKFCVKDPQLDWHRAFNYSSNLEFLTACNNRTNGDFMRRLCTAAEIKFYFSNFFVKQSESTNYLKPNKNCNLTSWVSGCEPGWACSVGPNQEVDLRNSRDTPTRTFDCQACCEGFFCPHGLTCMIPCPLGSYCPLARLNRATGVCEPYNYQLPPRQPNHTCGGANIWADVGSASEVFCSPGSYCPTTTEKTPCSSGHYCRMGSTTQKRCFKLTSCDPNTANQNIHAYGVLLIAALTTLLLIIYNCSDQFMSIRERRRAKFREAAARSAKEKAQARERWKAAKEAAKKRAAGLQAHFSGRFSRKGTATHSEKEEILSETRGETDNNSLSAAYQSTSSASSQSYASSDGKEMELSDLMNTMHSITEEPESFEVGDKHKKEMPKGKEAHTHSQIFKYAYSQLEKERAQQQRNKNLTFSGIISMATDTETRKRPVIEVAFRNLTLTLKGKNKQLLRRVTGKIMPGRITAVMGPSGAGKTTFLSALAGKAVGCTITGSILINGVAESMHSYRKIIGFVPQDDIVHGNLTIEENLWFSARCRLAADLPKADKVLIVERVIDSLGLQAVRGSLVGTVEKRGISGGQRKRVNVGLELVMEPSVLILDEPTSGLDSSSSQLLLRALRREALQGVNICMVVHQPSYTLFKMFDDLILLAKGGLTVYHGSIKKVEEYFAGLGIHVPERVNPPDHFIDVLEEIVKPSTSSGVSCKELPVRWMLHNGYPVPLDMQHNSAGNANPTDENGVHSDGVDTEERSFAGEMWQDVRCNVERHRDILRHNFLRSSDMSNRRTPGIILQYKYFLGRVGKQRLREAKIQAIDYLILLLAGACLGSITKVRDETFGAPGYTYTIIAVSLLCKIAALRSFSLDKLQYWRESSSGISTLAHFLAKDTVDHFNVVIKPVVYLSMYYFFSNPRSTFGDNYIVLLSLVYCVTGIAYVLAIFLEPGPSQLCSVLLPVVLTLIATQTGSNTFLKKLANLCYPKWALEAFVIANAESNLSMASASSTINLDGDEDQTPVTKKSRTTSKVWDWFTKLPSDSNDQLKAKCEHCFKVLSAKSSSGTSHLRRHMNEYCVKRSNHDIMNFTIQCESKSDGTKTLRNYKYDPAELRREIAKMIVVDERPFRAVEAVGFRSVMSKARPEFRMMSRSTIKRDIMAMYTIERENVLLELSACPGSICLTSDTWSSLTDDHYICVTAHFIDNQWKLHKRIICFKLIPPPYDTLSIEDELTSCLSKWNIENKVFSITLDNLSTNDRVASRIQARLSSKNLLPCNGAFFHVRCCAHILNLIVQAGFNAISDIIGKLRLGVKYVKLSPIRRKKFFALATSLNMDTRKKLCLDCPTRWNAIYHMLEVALHYKDAFLYLGDRDRNFKYNLLEDEWERVSVLCNFLKVFYEVTCTFSGMKYPTSNLYFKGVWRVHMKLLDVLKGPPNFLSDMVHEMHLKFNKYWSDYSLILSCGAILDPRYKLKFVEYCYTKIYGEEADQYINTTIATLYSLFGEYMKKSSSSTSCGSSGMSMGESNLVERTGDEFEDYARFEGNRSRQQVEKSQLDLYLEEPNLDVNSEIEILEYWCSSSLRYPDLAKMARDVLTIPVSSVASERAFSTGRRVISPYRCLLKSKTIQALICLQDWFLAYDSTGKSGVLGQQLDDVSSSSEDDDDDY